MVVLLQALVPVFALILLGHMLLRWQFPGDGFWPLAERFTYYVLFPVMLLYKLGTAHIPASAYSSVIALVLSMLGAMLALLAIVRFCGRWPGPVFSSIFQGSIRFNSFVGLAAAGLILGDDALSLFAVAVAVTIPLLNLLCIVMFAVTVGQGAVRLAPVVRAIVQNPLIIGSVAGAIWGFSNIGFSPILARFLEPLSDMALPLGLLTVGAGLRFKALRDASLPFLVASVAKLCLFPLMTAGLVLVLGVEGVLAQVAILLAALPTASSSYILARQLGGDAPLMAGIISGQTLLAMVTMPVMLALLW